MYRMHGRLHPSLMTTCFMSGKWQKQFTMTKSMARRIWMTTCWINKEDNPYSAQLSCFLDIPC